jgi:hypothetical protein
MRGGVPLAARARKRVDDMKSAVVRSTPKIRGEDEASFARRVKDRFTHALRKMYENEHRFVYGTSKHRPHQGAQECARRVRQGIAGTQYVHGSQYPSYGKLGGYGL